MRVIREKNTPYWGIFSARRAVRAKKIPPIGPKGRQITAYGRKNTPYRIDFGKIVFQNYEKTCTIIDFVTNLSQIELFLTCTAHQMQFQFRISRHYIIKKLTEIAIILQYFVINCTFWGKKDNILAIICQFRAYFVKNGFIFNVYTS